MPTLITFLLFAFTIVSSGGYNVTANPQAVTYYTNAHALYNSDVLLAHEDKAGAAFMQLKIGDEIQVTFPDRSRRFLVQDILRYTATDPLNVYSHFIDMSGNVYGSEELGKIIYTDGRLVLQTCYDNAKGRLFVIAYPKTEKRKDAR